MPQLQFNNRRIFTPSQPRALESGATVVKSLAVSEKLCIESSALSENSYIPTGLRFIPRGCKHRSGNVENLLHMTVGAFLLLFNAEDRLVLVLSE